MAILQGDIKLVKSQVMDDVPEGGGAPTANVIQDAVSNAIFPDISELDRAGGRVNLRKVFVTVQTDNTDTYLGANVIVAEPPEDPNVSITLFTTDNTFDRRDAARSRMEAYLAPGPEWNGYLLENHIAGQRSLQMFQRIGTTLPSIGQTMVLLADEDTEAEKLQYVRVTSIASEERTFTYPVSGGYADFKAMVVTCGISDALRYDFPGSAPSPTYTRGSSKTKLRDTVVADAAYYAGVVPLTEPVALGDLSAKCETIFTQLVPSAQTEIPMTDTKPAGSVATVIESAPADIAYTTGAALGPNSSLTLSNPIFPGSLSITGAGYTLTDSGGLLFSGATTIGTVNYATGLIAFSGASSSFTGSKTVTFRPAGAALQVLETSIFDVTAENRAYNYNLTIVPPPAPGTLTVSYLSNGKWYDLHDNGAGVLRGSDSAFGAGTVSYTTGTSSVTLGALPDAGGALLYSWGSKALYLNRSNLSIATPKIKRTLTHTGFAPHTLTITWNDGTARAASDDGAGNIIGDATGKIRYATGEIEFAPNALPAGGQTYTVGYSHGAVDTFTVVNPPREANTTITLTLGATDLIPGTVEVDFTLLVLPGQAGQSAHAQAAKDDGAGNLRLNGVAIGTINYAAGTINFQPNGFVLVPTIGYAGMAYSTSMT